MNLLRGKQLFFNVPFQSTKCKKKELCVDNEVQEAIGDVFCPTCRKEKCDYISTNKTSTFNDSKKCKTCCHVLTIPFKDQTPTIMLLGVAAIAHITLRKRQVMTTKMKNHLPMCRNFSAYHNQPHPNLCQKKQESFHS